MIEINLLPKELQKKKLSFKLDRTILLFLVGGLTLVGMMAIYTFVFQAHEYARIQKGLEVARAETARYTPEIAKIDEINNKKDQILTRISAIQLLDRNREYWVMLMEDLSSRVPEYLWLTSVRQAPSAPVPAQSAQNTTSPSNQPPPAVNSSIEGFSFSLNSLATFLVRLKKSDMFENIEISSVKLQEIEKVNAYAFKLTCNLVPSVPIKADTETAMAAGAQDNKF